MRAAHQGTGDQAEGGGRQSGHVGAGGGAGLNQNRTIGRSSGGAADQSGGADADADEGVLTEGHHDAAGQNVLDGDHDDGQDQDQNHGLTAADQGRDADGEADRGEEQVLEHGQDAVQNREQQAAHQGRGNTVAVQEADLAGDHASQPEQECAQRNSVVHIQTDLKHSCTVLSLCYFALQSFSGHRPPTQSSGFCKSKNTAF